MASAPNPQLDAWIENVAFVTNAIAGEGLPTIVAVANSLYSSGLVTQATRDYAITPCGLPPNNVVSQLMLPIHSRIKHRVPEVLSKFLSALRENGLSYVADKLQADSGGVSDVALVPEVVLGSSSTEFLSQYQDYLGNLYSTEYPIYPKPQFTVNRPKHTINLVMVHKEKNEADKLQRQCLLYQLQGNVDMIQQRKTRVNIEDIGVTREGKLLHFILVEGAPGIGKTTFCWQLARLWAKGKLSKVWDFVVLVQLRDEITRSAKSLSDLLYHPDHEIKEKFCQAMEKQEGKGLLLLFDGYDELSEAQLGEVSLLQRLLHKQVLREATVMVTSRPFATKSLPHQFKQALDRHTEIVGFDESDVDLYLSSACEDKPALLADFRLYVSSQPFISSVMYNPLHCSIVTELYIQYWQEGAKGFAPNSLTELYNALLLNLMRRSTFEQEVEELDDLPPDKHHQLMLLAELAASGIEERKYIFNKVPCDTLSLMHEVKPLHDIRARRSVSYTFMHLTLQEYLASLYWSRVLPDVLSKLIQRQDLFPIQQYLKGIHLDSKELLPKMRTHWSVLIFLAGLTKLSCLSPELIREWIEPTDGGDKILLHPAMCQLLFEAESPSLVSGIFKDRKVELLSDKLDTMLDWFVTGYCIAVSDASTSWSITYGLSDLPGPSCSILYSHKPQCLLMFSNGLRFTSNDLNIKRIESLFEMSIFTNPHPEFSTDTECLEIFTSLYPYTRAVTAVLFFGTLNPDDAGASVLLQFSHYFPKVSNLKLPTIEPPYLSAVPKLPHDTLNTLDLTLPIMKDDSALVPELQNCKKLTTMVLSSASKEANIFFFLVCLGPLLVSGQITALDLNEFFIHTGYVDVLSAAVASGCRLCLSNCEISNSDYAHLSSGCEQPQTVNGDTIVTVSVEIGK